MSMKYPLPSFTSINEGAQIDARFKLACAVLLSPEFLARFQTQATFEQIAQGALGIAESMYREASLMELVRPLDTEIEPTAEEVAHMKRNAFGQVIGQMHGQRVAQDEQSRVMRPGLLNGLNG